MKSSYVPQLLMIVNLSFPSFSSPLPLVEIYLTSSSSGTNLANIENVFHFDPSGVPAAAFKTKMIGYVTPKDDDWKIPLLRKLFDQRRDLFASEEDTSNIDPAASFETKNIGDMSPETDQCRRPFLRKLLVQRRGFLSTEEDTSTIDELIESLCAL